MSLNRIRSRYLKAILLLAEEGVSAVVSTGAIAQFLHVSLGATTRMMQVLEEEGLVEYSAHRGTRLTKQGRSAAESIVRRERLLETFLAQTLNLPWDQIEQPAAALAEAASPKLIERIDAHLGHPHFDPHGDPIPQPGQVSTGTESQSLASCPVGVRFEVRRVLDHEPALLQFLANAGLVIGAIGEVTEQSLSADVTKARLEQHELAVSREVASRILVRQC